MPIFSSFSRGKRTLFQSSSRACSYASYLFLPIYQVQNMSTISIKFSSLYGRMPLSSCGNCIHSAANMGRP